CAARDLLEGPAMRDATIHEAGHAVMTYLVDEGDTMEELQAAPSWFLASPGDTLGFLDAGEAQHYGHRVLAALAGVAAEAAHQGRDIGRAWASPGAASDLHIATTLAR